MTDRMTPEDWMQAIMEDPSCIEAYLAAAKAEGQAEALREAADECRALADEADAATHGAYWTVYARILAMAEGPLAAGTPPAEPGDARAVGHKGTD